MKSPIVLIFILIIVAFPKFNSYGNSIREETYQRLEKIRENKKHQLFYYLEKIRHNAEAVKYDRVMIDFFYLKSRFYKLQKTTPPPQILVDELDKLKKNIRKQYIWNYHSFYDILFVDKNGDIFYTIRQQADYHKNIFSGELAETALANQLKNYPHQTFVDYQYFSVSDEPSAFFIVPVIKENNLEGWFVFQCAINKINSIFTQKESLGTTGEIFLVNKQHYMLTDSRFYSDTSILKKKLSDENISAKFRENSGRKIVIDYRGFRTLSSFEVCHIANSEWLMISKIDEDEIITEQYKKNRKELRISIIKGFKDAVQKYCDLIPENKKMVEVDMDEFQKVKNKEMIRTFGISTCTALVFSLPEKFSYLTHISNLDWIYGGETTDLVGNILKRIKTFDIYQYEIRNLQITIIANHLETIINIIDRLVDEEIFLSQIKFIYNGKAIYANLFHDCDNNKSIVEWAMNRENPNNILYQSASDVEPVGDIIKPLIRYN